MMSINRSLEHGTGDPRRLSQRPSCAMQPGLCGHVRGVVVITLRSCTKAVAMRSSPSRTGPIRYLINTEHHVDHIFGNYYFKGAGTVVHHRA